MSRLARTLAAWVFLAAASTSMVNAQTGAGPARPLTVVTFNLFHGGPFSGLTENAQHLDRRLEMAAAELKDLHADIIGLQEASWSRQRGEVAARLAAQLGFQHVYAPASSRFFGNAGIDRAITSLLNFTEGPAIVSRFPFLGWHIDDLPRCGKLMDSRVLLSATLQTPWGRLQTFSAHTRSDPCQTRRVAELVRRSQSPLPTLLMGDFNAVPDSPAITALSREAGFADAFRIANPTLPGFTVWQQVDAPAAMVRRRGDYIFLIPGTIVAGKVLSARVILNTPGRLPDGRVLWPSDHYGVLAVLDIVGPQAR